MNAGNHSMVILKVLLKDLSDNAEILKSGSPWKMTASK
jgi:hypothetical protein